MLLSDAGGWQEPPAAVTITLDDAAASQVPDNGPLVSGTYRPSNFESVDVFPSPAPTPSAATTLATFEGTNPNGDWKLYVVDDDVFDAGSILNGWSITIQTGVALTTERIANTMKVSWPTNAGNFQLQQATNLTPVISWSPVAEARVTNSGIISATFSATDAQRFFRLKSP